MSSSCYELLINLCYAHSYYYARKHTHTHPCTRVQSPRTRLHACGRARIKLHARMPSYKLLAAIRVFGIRLIRHLQVVLYTTMTWCHLTVTVREYLHTPECVLTSCTVTNVTSSAAAQHVTILLAKQREY